MTSPAIANKDISEKVDHRALLAAGPDTPRRVEERHLHGAADRPADRARCATPPEMRKINQEQPFHPIYHYAFVTDAEEGLILVNVDTLADGDPRNNIS